MKITVETTSPSKKTIIIVAVAVAVILVVVGAYIYKNYYLDYYETVFSGSVKGNRKTKIYHIPKCSNYDRMNVEKVEEFQTVAEAEKAGYRPAGNCPEGIIEARKEFERK